MVFPYGGARSQPKKFGALVDEYTTELCPFRTYREPPHFLSRGGGRCGLIEFRRKLLTLLELAKPDWFNWLNTPCGEAHQVTEEA